MYKLILGSALMATSLAACASTQPERGERQDRSERRGQAQGAGPMTSVAIGGIWLAGLDLNGDYTISKQEFEQGKQKAFEAADTNNNQSLTLFELDDWRVKALGSEDASPGRFMFDPNFDQNISRGEFEVTLDGLFTRSDKDNDGQLYRSELVQIIDRSTRGRGGQGGGEGSGQRGGERGGGGRGGRGGGAGRG